MLVLSHLFFDLFIYSLISTIHSSNNYLLSALYVKTL